MVSLDYIKQGPFILNLVKLVQQLKIILKFTNACMDTCSNTHFTMPSPNELKMYYKFLYFCPKTLKSGGDGDGEGL